MASLEPLGLKRIEAVHYYVHNLERSRNFYTRLLDFAEIAHSSAELETRGKQRSVAFQAGSCRIGVSAPLGEGGRAWRYLRKHAEGVGSILFEVEDATRAFRLLEERGGTPIDEVQHFEDAQGSLAFFSITTPFGDTTFRFVERPSQPSQPSQQDSQDHQGLLPGWTASTESQGGSNAFGFVRMDHITSNFPTMAPALLWLEHVLGFERYWQVQFHTDEVDAHEEHGSGLKSVVMWDPKSGIKFANNEPYRPFFKQSQINIFNEEHRGSGVQHIALEVSDIIHAVRGLKKRGVTFMPTPDAYYEKLPQRIQKLGVGNLDESIETLKELGILVDGQAQGRYMLQIFLKESAAFHHDASAGPFFYEIIQRKGDQGFGAGNFRALFESIEDEQRRK